MKGVTQKFGKFRNGITQKRLGVPLRCYEFWNKRIEVYKLSLFSGLSEVSPKILEKKIETVLLKNSCSCLLDIMIFGSRRIELYKVCMFLGRSDVSPKILVNFQNSITKKTAGLVSQILLLLLLLLLLFKERIEIYKVGMFLGRPVMSPKILVFFQNGVTQKQLNVPLIYYYFWNQCIEVYKIGLVLSRSEVSPKILETF